MALCCQAANGLIGPRVIWLALIALPATVLGAAIGARAYHAMNDRNFTDVVLALLFLSGLGLVWNSIGIK